MIMFKDYWKLNKLNIIVMGILLGLIMITSCLIVVAASCEEAISYKSWLVSYIPIILLYGNLALAGLLSLTLFVTAIKTFIGTSRQFLLMQRGRSYYLKLQLLSVTLSSLVVGTLATIVIILFRLYFYVNETGLDFIPPLKVYTSDFSLLLPVIVTCIFILVYYLIMYLIDIFSNTNLRYKRMSVRNLAILRFILRTVLIGGLTFYIFIAAENLRVLYESPYSRLITQNSPYINSTICLVFIILIPVLIIDYMVFFKKKVLV